MNFLKKTNTIFVLIVCVAVFLRFSQLASNPPSLTWDEVAWGYNAYSLGINAHDEFGKFLPITYLESFGDFKPPLYAYLSILPVMLFGLTEFATRFASAFFGVLTVIITFFLTRRIFAVNKKRDVIAYLSAGILAISPWHILLSRAAFEANVASFFIVFGVFLFLEALSESKKRLLIVSLISFVLSMYTFNTARIVVPILALTLFLFNWKYFVYKIRRETIIAVLVSGMLFLPLFLFLLTPQARLRFNEVNIFSDVSVIERTNQQIANDNNSLLSKVIHNRRFTYGVEYIKHYFDNLSPSFLFIKGDGNPKFSIQDVGQLYLWELPFLVFGGLMLFRKKEGFWYVLPLWLIIGIIPAGSARETPHALRIETVIPTLQILVAYGLFNFLELLRNNRVRKAAIIIVSFAVFFNFLYFHHNYTTTYATEFSGEWQYGYKEAVLFLNTIDKNYDKVYFTEALGRPYAYVLFYKKYSPNDFLKEAKVDREALGFVHVRSFGKYEFVKDVGYGQSRAVYVNTPEKVPSTSKILKTVNLLNGKPALVIYE